MAHTPRLAATAILVALTLAAAATACDDAAPAVERCTSSSDCSAGRTCVDGECRTVVSVDDTTGDTATDANDADDTEDAPLDTTEPDPDLSDLSDLGDVPGDASDATDATDAADTTDLSGPCSACSPTELCCEDRCIDPATSSRHCGGCGVSCLAVPDVAAASCQLGVCRIDACALGFLDCDGDASNGCEAAQGEANCGGCGLGCGDGATCVDGACACDVPSCPCPGGGALGDDANCTGCGLACGAGEQCQGNRCVCPDGGVVGDALNCGACGQACGASEVCANGTCICASGVLGDALNCGACGQACGASEVCASDRCVCQSGALGDDQNCVACGQACPAGTSCAARPDGTRVCSCGSGLILCGASCIDPENDPAHCGACNVACPGGTSCRFGACALNCPANRADCDASLATGCEQALDDDASCGSECGTVRDCGGFGDDCVASAGSYTCRCDDNRTCRPGERCEGFDDRCECASGVSCGASEVCCLSGGQRLCIELQTDARHCGQCNRACEPGLSCVAGNCQ